MLSLIDYRGLHYKKIIIQGATAVLVFFSSLLGMYSGHSVVLSVLAMFLLGLLMALVRNWSDYGPSIAVSAGFFFLLGLANPVPFEKSIDYGLYLLTGCGWAMLITLLSFPFQPSNPLRRSVSRIWKANTDLLDIIVQKLARGGEEIPLQSITEKELAVRKLIDQSRSLFASRQTRQTRMWAAHYDQMLELRKTASLFAASLSSMHEELEFLNTSVIQTDQDISFYKTLSAFSQASARIAIVTFTLRPDDLAIARIKVERCEVAVELFIKALKNLKLSDREEDAVQHFTSSLYYAMEYLNTAIAQLETKLGIQKSGYLENYKISFHDFMVGIRPDAIGSMASEFLRFNSRQFSYAIRVALGLAIGVFIFRFFHIDHGYWIPLTMMIVIQPYYGATLKKGIERMTGTLAGVVAGGLVLLLPLSHETSIVILVIDSFFVAWFLRNNYKWGVFFVTIMMVLLMQLSQQGSWELIGWRILSTLAGALLALLAGYAFWPDWEKDHFPQLMQTALSRNKDYLTRLLVAFGGDVLPNTLHRERRLAESANDQAFSSVQRMLGEPERARNGVENHLAMVGANIRISRELTSVALEIENKPISTIAIPSGFSKDVELAFNSVIQTITQSGIADKPDFAGLKQKLNGEEFFVSEQGELIRTELEKVLFELEAIWLHSQRGK